MKQAFNKNPFHQLVQKVLLSCGMLSSLLYVAMLLIVPMQYEGYNSVNQTISELSAIGAPTRPLWVPLGIVYTLLIAAFGWGIRQAANDNRRLHIAGTLLFAYGIIGIGGVFAPMHQRAVLAAGGSNISDTMHLVMGAVSNLFMMVSMGFAGAAFGKKFRLYTILTILTLLTFGILTAMKAPAVNANRPTAEVGILEMVMLGAFLLWAVLLSIILLRSEKMAGSQTVMEQDHFLEKIKSNGQLRATNGKKTLLKNE